MEYECSTIDYFPKEEYSPDPSDSTMAIPCKCFFLSLSLSLFLYSAVRIFLLSAAAAMYAYPWESRLLLSSLFAEDARLKNQALCAPAPHASLERVETSFMLGVQRNFYTRGAGACVNMTMEACSGLKIAVTFLKTISGFSASFLFCFFFFWCRY